MTVIAALAVTQGVLGILRSLRWFESGSDFMGQGLLILPLVGMLAYFRGVLVAGIALSYVAFAWGVFMRRDWAWSVGLVVAALNLFLVLSVMVQGESLVQAIFWAIVPMSIVWYLVASRGER
jgi:hypothetical protein